MSVNARWRGTSRGWLKRELARRHGLICQICGSGFKRQELEMDHITPWSQGGPSTLENLQLLCGTCHRQKEEL